MSLGKVFCGLPGKDSDLKGSKEARSKEAPSPKEKSISMLSPELSKMYI